MWLSESVLLSSGVDYLSTTTVDPVVTKVLLAKGAALLQRQNRAGNFVRPWAMSGYSGWRCGGVQFGVRDDGAIVRVSGEIADIEWWELYQTTLRCSRIDLQATFRVAGDPQVCVLEFGRLADEIASGDDSYPRVTKWVNAKGGATVYLGSRSSDLYFRCYNKEAQSLLPQYERCVRLELEVKGRLAKRTIESCLQSSTFALGLRGCLSRYLSDRGISANFGGDFLGSFYEPSTKANDIAKSLEWLTRAVKPSVQRLVDYGCTAEVLECLGLQNTRSDS